MPLRRVRDFEQKLQTNKNFQSGGAKSARNAQMLLENNLELQQDFKHIEDGQ